MMLGNLLLKKDKIRICNEACFNVPIHPRFLDKNVRLDTEIAKNRLLKQAA